MITKPGKSKTLFQKWTESYEYLKTSWGVQTKEFFKNSTLHGVKYISASDRPFIERFMWFICVIAGTVATCAVIFSLWDKFQTNPTITGLDTHFHDWQVPFPAVTLCPEKPASLETIRSFLGIPENVSSEDNEKINLYYDVSRLSLSTITEFSEKYQNNGMIAKTFNVSQNLRQLAFKLMNKCDDVFDTCRFKDEPIQCCHGDTKSFYPVLTEVGLCYSFNSRHFEKINREVQFNMQYIKETDIKWSLEFSMSSGEALTSIYIINPDDMIGIDVQPQLIWDNQVEKMSFSVKQTYTTDDTRQLSIKQRRCIFEDEIKLKVDKIYSYTACTIECRMKNIKRICDCVPFFYPKVPGFRSCNMTRLSCLDGRLSEIMDISKCDCQLGCKNTVYEVETQTTRELEANSTSMEIGFVSWPMVRYKREVLFGWVDLLVSFGGIAGLFLGFSLLSGVEILYYFTLRACIAAFRERKYLDRVRKENEEKPQPMHDLSLIPYFISKPLPGHGIDIIVKRFDTPNIHFQTQQKHIKPKVIKVGMMPPFGIEFVN